MKQFVVVGLGRFGVSVATTLAENGHDVLAIDRDPEKVQAISGDVTHAVEADATDEEALKTLGVRNFDVAVVSIGDNVSANILCTLILKELGVPYVIVKAPDKLHGKVLSKVGADRIVYPERDMGVRIAQNLISSNVLDYIEFAPEYGVIEILASDNMIGKTLKELELRASFDVNVMAIKRGDQLYISPGAEDKIEIGDKLVLMGKNENLDKMRDFGN
ncbi:MAG: trk system potassium uptake protein TrkA [Halanaerobium sp. 4-GBenrich]|jgi:trk system potassium uptake protein TrkA|uniref:Trk system potassium uptake protein TrkA n=1 Tax=Halanaerobium congolense TaxID=54121 RepID=A0A1G6NWU8_9FIRM|nr:TrkA family potassium uptake protein [Halanaerobium congolense]KXS48128.1 MAG: trk system potassium uptake protein TrkA [Halanaerobium sp. T82-1]ODS50896.1 MAG: trk system potassium uptake protein TrkA [Halanaerobium sp. 4-GBenrich]PUU90871.1 MAG: trk system potassium uptake protein TrkA [Halanaerobium sp.]PTX17804.1 trk system potassium uptake protein TrkA [Halanaerobium congolense]TDS26333.1 trk system potassium uptake protein TrkA [Halanaerobium congolense]